MSLLQTWPSWADLGIELVLARHPSLKVRTRYHATTDPLPFCRVSVVDAGASQLNAYPTIDFEWIGKTYKGPEMLAREFDSWLMEYPRSVTSDGRVVLLDAVESISAPVELDLDEEAPPYRFLSTYQLSIRRR